MKIIILKYQIYYLFYKSYTKVKIFRLTVPKINTYVTYRDLYSFQHLYSSEKKRYFIYLPKK